MKFWKIEKLYRHYKSEIIMLLMPNPFSHSHHNMIRIPGGTYFVGSKIDDALAYGDEYPELEVSLTPFDMGKYLITQEIWQAVMGYNPSEFVGKRHPVESVNWFEAIAFCNRLSKKEGIPCVYFTDKYFQNEFSLEDKIPQDGEVFMSPNQHGYRLPTEAEWEYAAGKGFSRGKELMYPGGDHILRLAWHSLNSNEETQEVGLLEPNPFGLMDMTGNVGEWCWDWYDYNHFPESQTNPTGRDIGDSRVVRGGSIFLNFRECRITNRELSLPSDRDSVTGFRLVRSASKA